MQNCIKEIDFFFKIGIVCAYVVELLHLARVLLIPSHLLFLYFVEQQFDDYDILQVIIDRDKLLLTI